MSRKPFRSGYENAVLSRHGSPELTVACELIHDYLIEVWGEPANVGEIINLVLAPNGNILLMEYLQDARIYFSGDRPLQPELSGDLNWVMEVIDVTDVIAMLSLAQDSLDVHASAAQGCHEATLIAEAVCDVTTAMMSLKKLQRLKEDSTPEQSHSPE